MNDQSHTTAVSVALSLCKGSPMGDRPDAEELAALYESRLSPRRRSEVLSHLANDEALYSEWLNFYEYVNELGISAEAAIEDGDSANADKPARQDSKPSFAASLKKLFNFYTFIPGTALAGLAVFMLFFQASQPSGVDGLYQEYGLSVSGQLELPTRSLGNFWAEPEPERFIVSQGFKAGLDRLKADVSGLELLASEPEQPAGATLTDGQRETLNSVGEWAALTSIQCSGQTADYFVAAEHVWESLLARLKAIDTPYVASLTDRAGRISASAASEQRVCEVAGIIASDARR